jgi:uncharacterized protein
VNVAAIHIYPVKSLAGQAVASEYVEPWGLRHDRRWLVLDPDGTVITAREEHRLLGLSARPTENGIELASRGGSTLDVATPLDGELVPTSTSRLESVRLADGDSHRWLSSHLQRPVRLAWLDDPRRRSVSVKHGGFDGDPLTLADAGPLLLTTSASLRQLNDWMVGDALTREDDAPNEMVMARFRPNVVIEDVPEAFEEDGWRTLLIGSAEFRFAEQCDRCVMTTLDPRTLAGGKEPLRTLARHRQWEHKTWFGIRVIPTTTSLIRLGDRVEVPTRQPSAASSEA